jgi:hypothetical protein
LVEALLNKCHEIVESLLVWKDLALVFCDLHQNLWWITVLIFSCEVKVRIISIYEEIVKVLLGNTLEMAELIATWKDLVLVFCDFHQNSWWITVFIHLRRNFWDFAKLSLWNGTITTSMKRSCTHVLWLSSKLHDEIHTICKVNIRVISHVWKMVKALFGKSHEIVKSILIWKDLAQVFCDFHQNLWWITVHLICKPNLFHLWRNCHGFAYEITWKSSMNTDMKRSCTLYSVTFIKIRDE